jgi:hypothetical protein
MGGLALAAFIGLFTFGERVFHWHDPEGKVQIALVAAFLFGLVSGFRSAKA